ncbi:hypothetical protein [Agitococcus lubricus]|uniref:Uncharacterized protein n=1 Tax=Agitococcus lubricus TaxID=1077255 RepID=A0A2T5J0V1_9GAMM|nr:hypothetical protein [Agitococcus lubricus]PTQ89993.1 hypothetical protein C8N29_10431 [Agitococcus lubricus]
MNQVRGVIILFVISYLIHAMLLVNSAETELYNNQKSLGELVTKQLATNAAPLLLSQDSVGLGLLADRFGESDIVLNVRIIQHNQVVATGGSAQSQHGNLYQQPIELDKQVLGEVVVELAKPARGDIIQHSLLNLLLSFVIHVFMTLWIGWPHLFKRIRIPILASLPDDNAEAPAPVLPAAMPTPEPEPVKPAASVFVYFSFDDRKNLMQKVNANTADQFLLIVDKLLKRASRLYTGKTIDNLTADGVCLRFDGDHIEDCMNRAVLSSRLLLKLADSAYHKRRQAKQFALRLKAASVELQAEQSDDTALQLAKRLVSLTTVNQLLVSANDNLVSTLQNKHQLKAYEASEDDNKNKDIKAHFVESLAPEIEEELNNLEKRILERKKPDSNSPSTPTT